MKLPAIRKLVETYTLEELQQAEAMLIAGEPLPFEVEGSDEGEQLTHILGSIEILYKVKHNHEDPRVAMRAFFERVRTSIS